MNKHLPYLDCCNELASYIERASCAVSVLGELLVDAPEEKLDNARTQSIGFLLEILGDGMLQRSMDSYAFVGRCHREVSSVTDTADNSTPR